MATHESTRKMSGGSRSFTVGDFRKFVADLPADAVVTVDVSPRLAYDPRERDMFRFKVDLAHTDQED